MLYNPILRSLRIAASLTSCFTMSKKGSAAALTPSRKASSGGSPNEKSGSTTEATDVSHTGVVLPAEGPGLHHFDKNVLSTVDSVIINRWTCRNFDETRSVDENLIRRLLNTTMRAPTGFNLQPWHAIVVQDAERRKALCTAALGQPQIQKAPLSIVFVGDMEAERNAPQVLEMGLENGYLTEAYAPLFLRNVYYFLHGGPLQAMALTKSVLSSCYSKFTGTPLLSVPVSMKSYAWKQTMIPVTTFVHLCTAAGLNTCIMEGMDEEAVKKVVGLSGRYTVPVIVSVGYAAPPPVEESSESGGEAAPSKKQKLAWSPRFAFDHVIRWEKF
ncbi:unnamed protein product [Phytomonas sp. EM1]|nr:unnamed protein product [Phytomonas sp. EM1]|eukprot:CCW61331.1 unnamed protein product [Phytomonas sp. isolate EM1]